MKSKKDNEPTRRESIIQEILDMHKQRRVELEAYKKQEAKRQYEHQVMGYRYAEDHLDEWLKAILASFRTNLNANQATVSLYGSQLGQLPTGLYANYQRYFWDSVVAHINDQRFRSLPLNASITYSSSPYGDPTLIITAVIVP